jgi:hypothetical protein
MSKLSHQPRLWHPVTECPSKSTPGVGGASAPTIQILRNGNRLSVEPVGKDYPLVQHPIWSGPRTVKRSGDHALRQLLQVAPIRLLNRKRRREDLRRSRAPPGPAGVENLDRPAVVGLSLLVSGCWS